MTAQVRWDPARAEVPLFWVSQGHFDYPQWPSAGAHGSGQLCFLPSCVPGELSTSILIALTQHHLLQFRNYSSEGFVHFFQTNVFLYFFFPFLSSIPFLPLFFLFPPTQHWLTFTRTQCDLVTLGILCTLICQFGKLICGRMSGSQRSGSWSTDLLTG